MLQNRHDTVNSRRQFWEKNGHQSQRMPGTGMTTRLWLRISQKQQNPAHPATTLPPKTLLYNTMLWNNVLWGMGGSWTKQDGTANLNTPEGIKAVQLYSDIYTKGWASKDSAQAEFPETQAALKSGNPAFAIQWSAGFAELNDAAKSPAVAGKIAIARVPNGKTHVHALAVALNKYSASKGAAL